MATYTYTYTHAVKVNGEIVPPNTPVEITDAREAAEKPAAKTRKKKNDSD